MLSDSLLVVGVDTPEEEVDSEICNHYADKSQQTIEVENLGPLKHPSPIMVILHIYHRNNGIAAMPRRHGGR